MSTRGARATRLKRGAGRRAREKTGDDARRGQFFCPPGVQVPGERNGRRRELELDKCDGQKEFSVRPEFFRRSQSDDSPGISAFSPGGARGTWIFFPKLEPEVGSWTES